MADLLRAPTRERTGLLFVLTVATVAATVAVFVHCGARPRVPAWMLAALGAPWIAFNVFLRVRRADYGHEGRYVDLWSISHFIAGALLAFLGIGPGWVVALAVAWELVELASRVTEYAMNRVVDVGLAALGGVVTASGLAAVASTG